MKLVGVIGTAALFLLLGTTAPAYAQHEEHAQEAKPAEHAQQPQHAQEAKPAERAQQPQHAQQAQPAQHAQQPQHAQQAQPAQHAQQQQHAQQAQPAQHAQQPQHAQQAQPAQHAQQQQHAQQAQPAQHAQQQHAQQAQRVGGNRGGRIPDDRFRAQFGHDHRFRINRPMIVAGNPRFQYGGYWFGFIDTWPADWYYTDDVYVDYIDGGYYLYNPVHPGVRIAISVVIQ